MSTPDHPDIPTWAIPLTGKGTPGPAGSQGAPGIDGIDGADGAAGAAGAIGAQGPTGATGVSGLDGIDGLTGAAGAAGATGSQGLDGIDGLTGPTGPAGSSGPQGLDGIDGLPGPTGPTGVMGLTVPTGIWFSPNGQGNSVVTPVVGTLYLCPFYIPSAITLSGLGVMLGSSSPSNDAQLLFCLYDNVASGWLPGSLLYKSAAHTGAPMTANAPQSDTGLAVVMAAGVYWAGFMFAAATTLTSCIQVAQAATSVGKAMPLWTAYGTGASPTVSAGNDGTIATQTGLSGSVPPNTFAGALLTNSNNPSKAPTIFLKA